MRYPFVLIALMAISVSLCGQGAKLNKSALKSLAERELQLSELAYTMHTDSSAAARFTACKELIQELVTTLKQPNSYHYPFDSLRGLAVRHSPDNEFRFFTWELHVNADEYRHYGAIQMNARDLQLVPLFDRGNDLRENPENTVLTAENWLGYTVYDIVASNGAAGEKLYFLFGYDRYGKWRRQKVLDVLTFDGSRQPSFGAPIFTSYSEDGLPLPDRHRMIFYYSAEANMVLEYSADDNSIYYENLVLLPGPSGEGPVYMPDGSYHALTPDERGMWVETEKVYHHKYEEAPREAGKAPAGRDLFGRERN